MCFVIGTESNNKGCFFKQPLLLLSIIVILQAICELSDIPFL